MNKFFKSAAERYRKISDKEYFINPISEVDCEIIIELGQILYKAGLTDVTAILKTYKEFKDAEVRDSLMQWNIDNPSLKKVTVIKQAEKDKQTEEFEEHEFPVLFKIGDIILNELNLRGLKLYERYDEEREDYVYGIIVNPVPEGFAMKSVPMFANEKIEFFEEENRKVALDNLSNFLMEKGIDIIDLEGNE